MMSKMSREFTFNPIPTGCCHVTLIYGLIPPMAGRNREGDGLVQPGWNSSRQVVNEILFLIFAQMGWKSGMGSFLVWTGSWFIFHPKLSQI